MYLFSMKVTFDSRNSPGHLVRDASMFANSRSCWVVPFKERSGIHKQMAADFKVASGHGSHTIIFPQLKEIHMLTFKCANVVFLTANSSSDNVHMHNWGRIVAKNVKFTYLDLLVHQVYLYHSTLCRHENCNVICFCFFYNDEHCGLNYSYTGIEDLVQITGVERGSLPQ